MKRTENTIFISYRRTNRYVAIAIYQNLARYGYDVFLDYTGIGCGDFERVILENIKARAHFLVLLTPSALERIDEPGDWLRREIEIALETQRNIVPLMLDGFDFNTPSVSERLRGTLTALRHYNALLVPPEYFDEAMDRLRTGFLSIPLDAVLHPVSRYATRAVRVEQNVANAAPSVGTPKLNAEQWFERGLQASECEVQIDCLDKAINLNPGFAEAYNVRGVARRQLGDVDGAFLDFGKAIQLSADLAEAFVNRGIVRGMNGDREGAIQDYSEAIRIDPDRAEPYNNRGIALGECKDIEGALLDFNEAIRINPHYAEAYYNRGVARATITKEWKDAIGDFTAAIREKSNYAAAYLRRGMANEANGDRRSALADYTEAIRHNTSFANAYNKRAAVRETMGNESGAREDRTTAIRLDPELVARKYIRKKQYDRALEVYQRRLEEKPDDVRAQMRIGDIQSKMGLLGEALATFDRVARLLEAQGHFLQAISVYKQGRELIQKYVPHLADQYVHMGPRLAECYARLGLLDDAVKVYDEIATRHARLGRKKEALDASDRIARLAASSPQAHIRRAEILFHFKETDQGMKAFIAASDLLRRSGREDDLVRVIDRALSFQADPDLARLGAKIQLKRGTHSESLQALVKLQICLRTHPRDMEVLALLAEAFRQLDQPKKALDVRKEMALVARENGDVGLFERLAAQLKQAWVGDAEAQTITNLDHPKPTTND